MSVSSIPTPSNWRNDGAILLFGGALFGASGIASAVILLRSIGAGDTITTLIALGSAVFCLCITACVARIRFATPPLRGSSGPSGTTLRPDRTLLVFMFTALGAAVPSGILYCIYAPRGEVGIQLSPGERIFSPILIGLLVLIALWGLTSLAARGEAGHFAIGPTGIEIVSLGAKPLRATWDDIIDIKDAYKKARHPVVFVRRDGDPYVLKNASGFAPNGAVTYWMVRHYWQHPEDRVELTDGRALERLRVERFHSQ